MQGYVHRRIAWDILYDLLTQRRETRFGFFHDEPPLKEIQSGA